jgi:hypothetical protein
MQTTSHILMIRPVNFGFNADTAMNNAFQVPGQEKDAHDKALKEFTGFVEKLRSHGVDVTVVDDSPEPHTPDSIFPNNWVSFHDDGTVVLYPMYAPSRRLERKPQVLEILGRKFSVGSTIDLSGMEQEGKYLEGTGSMVLDREHRIAYACLSARTDAGLLEDLCRRIRYRPMAFDAVDQHGTPIYHTNVMMCVADRYVVICMDSIPSWDERKAVAACIAGTGKHIVTISLDQMNHFAGNMLQVRNEKGETHLVMSTQAYRSLTPEQVNLLETFNPIIHSPLDTIEANGGGSARCMMAEVFLPERS